MWDPAAGRLLSVDMLDGDVLFHDLESGKTTRTHVHCVVGCVRPRVSGGYVLAVERGFAFLDGDGQAPELLPELWTDRNVRMNDGGCDPQGRFYCGSMAYNAQPDRGTVWRLDTDGHAKHILDEVTVSNGIVWSLDGSTVYYIDSPTRRVDAFTFDADAGRLTDRRPFITVPDDVEGKPDGMTIDTEGGLWVAFFGGSCVRHYDSTGREQERIELPVTQVTACAFGGPGLDELFISTSSYGLGHHYEETEPDAGALFRVKPGATGVPVVAYAG